MTRTEYTCAIRKAGFSVRPVWQGKSELSDGHTDLTCYAIHSAEGEYVTQMLVQDFASDPGLDVFFASPNMRAADDIAFLKHLSAKAVA